MPLISTLANASSRGYGMFGGGAPFTLEGNFYSIATVTVPSGGASTVSFAGVPTGYKHLQIRAIGRDGRVSTSNLSYLRFNGDSTTANYKTHALYGDGASAGAYVDTVAGAELGYFSSANATTNVMGTMVIDILDYSSSTKNKTIRTLSGTDNNGNGIVALLSAAWFSTAPVTSIDLYCTSTSFAQHTQFALYGVK